MTLRTPTKHINDSLTVDPNASSCPLCEDKDTMEMVECEKCKNWYHFQCVGVNSSVAKITWICLTCTTKSSKAETRSLRSSMSSRRRSVLQLEKLTREKAIQDKLIVEKAKLAERQAEVDDEFLRKEFEIRENMTDPEDDDEIAGDENTSRSKVVSDWLESTNTTHKEANPRMSEPLSYLDNVMWNLGATSQQLTQTALDRIRSQRIPNYFGTYSGAASPYNDDLSLIPSKHVQFAQPLMNEELDTNPAASSQTRWSMDMNRNPNELITHQHQPMHLNAVQIPPKVMQPTDMTLNVIPSVSSQTAHSQAKQNTTVQHQTPDPSSTVVNYMNQPPLIPTPANIVQNSAQTWTAGVISSQKSTQSAPTVQQQLPTSISSQQQLTSISTQQLMSSLNLRPPTVKLNVSHQSTTVTGIQSQTIANLIPPWQTATVSSCQYPTMSSMTTQQQSGSNVVLQQQFGSNVNPQQQFGSNVNPQQQFGSNVNPQQQFGSNVIPQHQFGSSLNTQQQSTFGSNTIPQIPGPNVVPPQSSFGSNMIPQSNFTHNQNMPFNTLGFVQPPPPVNPWVSYDPELNPQQLPPTRLQLAARQTMPKDYPKFNGDPEKWSIFYNSYANCTTSCGLSNGENLSRLERCLENPARKAIQNLLTRPEAVPDIIGTLKMLYGRPEASIDAQLKVITNEAPPKMHKMETFIDFAMSVRNVTSEIQKTGMWQYLWNPQLMQQLVDKLPYQMRLEWGQIKLSTPNLNLSSFSDWLFLRAQTACAVTIPSSSDKKPNSNANGHINTHSKTSDSAKKNSNNPKNHTNSDKKPCQACNGKSHDIYECRKFLGMSINERWETVKSNKICRICLGNHHVLKCESSSLCGENGCTIKHHRLLHNSTKDIWNTTTKNENRKSNNENVHSAHQQSKIVILRRYIPVILYGPSGPFKVIAFLDEGSDMTLIENSVAQKLGLTGIQTDLYLEWTAKIVRKEPNSKSVSLQISGTRSYHKRYDIKDARTVKSLDLPSQTVNFDELRNTFKFLRRIPVDSYTNETPKILIGLRDCKLSTPLKTRSEGWDDPIVAKTLLGWEVHGSNAPSAKVTNVNFHSYSETDNDENLHEMVAQFFSLENFGVKKPEQTVEALSDKRARKLLESTTKRIGKNFETGLLWKYDNVSLPESLPMAKRRLMSLEKRLQKDPELGLKFRMKFHEYVEKGYIRKLSAIEEAETNGKTWYLPLFPVTYPKKPGKIRLVWDAAAKASNISLNSMLLSGPDLLVSLTGVLYRFRQGAYVVTGDIREMFHQVWIRKEDQMSQRFLWREEGSPTIDVYVLQVMSFGATCSPSSAQYIKNYNAFQFIEQYPRAEMAIRLNTYVDDWLQSFDTEDEAEKVANEVKYVHSEGGFEIRNWLSNSPQINNNLGTNPDVEQKLSLSPDESQTERILGMWWSVKEDAFTYSLRYNPINKEILMGNRRPTKREALRTLMSIYDPIGFLASYLVHLKMILQDIWRIGLGWDEQIREQDDDNLYDRWRNWIKYLPEIERVHIKRHYSPKINFTKPPKIELHIFVDASEFAYATVAYFRIENEDGVECSLIGGKTKVAPLKPLSIPRMELQAAVLGARFKNSIKDNHTLNIQRTVFWSDSSTVISWLRSDLRKYTQYVGARVGEILETTQLSEWRWIPSKKNPADDATKWKNSFSLGMNSRWFEGPDFLLQDEKSWPTRKCEVEETQEELRPKYVHAHTKAEIEELPIKFEQAVKWKRTMAFAIRFLNNVKARLGKPGFNIRTGLLRRVEFIEGENALYRKAQWDEFAPEIQMLRQELEPNERRKTVEKTSPLYRYSPYLDYAGVLRMRGRIDRAPHISIDQQRPIILPTKHQITELIVREYHLHYKHRNTETVVNEIKQRFIIPRLRALHKRIRRSCQHCKNATVQPAPPEMAQLPAGRLASFTRQYTYVGVDYAGPYKITQLRKSVKRWIVLFTCLTIRAVYIDVVESLTTDSCIMAINRFIARNGTPREFFSDRGTQFVGADNELAREIANIDHDLLNVKFTTCYTQWNFNPPYGQHMGGAWERLIGSMKTTLDQILPKSHYPNHETFVTALAEVENIINSRPLTFVSIEQDDQEALTPNHFLKGSSNGNKPPGIFPTPPATLRGNWRYAQQIANEFWRKWVKEYLPMITRRTKWFDDVKSIKVGDQVIIVDENSPRNLWDRGVVIEASQTGTDGRISRASVRTINGVYTRPVSKLAVLDIKRPEAKPLTRETLAGGSVTASNQN